MDNIPIARPVIDRDEIAAVPAVPESAMPASGARVAGFERSFSEYFGTTHAVSINNDGTAALHAADISPGTSIPDHACLRQPATSGSVKRVLPIFDRAEEPVRKNCRMEQ